MDPYVNVKRVKVKQPDPPRRKNININEAHKRKGLKKKKKDVIKQETKEKIECKKE